MRTTNADDQFFLNVKRNLIPSFDVSSARIHCSKKFPLVRTIFSVGGCGHLCCSWLGIVVFRVLNPKSSAMADREDNVYKAKLAEQAERYDGKFKLNLYIICVWCFKKCKICRPELGTLYCRKYCCLRRNW